MEPLTLLAWVGAIAVSSVTLALTILIVWTAIQTMLGKTTKSKPQTTVILNGHTK